MVDLGWREERRNPGARIEVWTHVSNYSPLVGFLGVLGVLAVQLWKLHFSVLSVSPWLYLPFASEEYMHTFDTVDNPALDRI